MHNKLLMKICIPHSIKIGRSGKATRKLWNNYLLGGWKLYNGSHNTWLKATEPLIKQLYAKKPWEHIPDSKYRISLGFYKGKSTKRCDVSNMSLLLKWCEDLIIEHTSIPDDSFNYIVEARCVYLGQSSSGEEEVYLQVTKDVEDEEVERSRITL